MKTEKINSEVPLSVKRASVVVYGKAFPFPPPGEKNHEAARKQASIDGRAYGFEVQQAMIAQKGGAPLTTKEQVTGKLATPAVESAPRSLRKPPPDTAPNPYDAAITSESSRVAMTKGEKDRQAARLARLQELRARKQEAIEQEAIEHAALVAHETDPEILRARAYVDSLIETSATDRTMTAEARGALHRLKEYADRTDSRVSDFWTQAKAFGVVKDTPARLPVAIEQPLTDKLAAGEHNVYEGQKHE